MAAKLSFDLVYKSHRRKTVKSGNILYTFSVIKNYIYHVVRKGDLLVIRQKGNRIRRVTTACTVPEPLVSIEERNRAAKMHRRLREHKKRIAVGSR